MTSLYLPEHEPSLYQESYKSLYILLKNHYKDEITLEMVESLKWKLTPNQDQTMKMVHKETGEEHNPLFIGFGSYDPSSEIFSWRNNEIKDFIKEFIEHNYRISETLGSASCFMTELFSDFVHIKNEDHVIIPTFIRMFHKIFRLVRFITNDTSDKKYYYGLINYEFEDHTDFDEFMKTLSEFSKSLKNRLHEQQLQNSENVNNANT